MKKVVVDKYYDSRDKLMAIVIPHDYSADGIQFLTGEDEYQQVATMNHKKGHSIVSHYHNDIERVVSHTCETLIIRRGILRVNLYECQILLYSFNIAEGDVITLYSGGHGFEVIDDVDMIEIKQGPYLGMDDKVRF